VCGDSATSFLRALPKCEQHIHIEGSLEPQMLFELADKHGMKLDERMYSTIPALEERSVVACSRVAQPEARRLTPCTRTQVPQLCQSRRLPGVL